MANKIILKSGETVPTVDNLEELEPGIDKTTNKLYTKINGQIIPLNDTSWKNIQNKPETFPPSKHTHEIVDIENLESEITLIKDTIEEQTSQIENINTDIEDLNNNKMDSPNSQTDSSATGYFLKQSNSNQGHWFYLQEANQNNTGLLSSSGYNLFLDKLAATNTGTYGQFLMRNNNSSTSSKTLGTWTTIPNVSSSQNGLMTTSLYNKLNAINRYVKTEGSSGVWTYRIWSNGFMELWASIYVSTPVSYTLGENWYRSNSPFTQTRYQYPYSFKDNTYPNIQASFYSTNNQSALIWLNPTISYRENYIPSLYLIRPSKSDPVTGYIHFYISGETNV